MVTKNFLNVLAMTLQSGSDVGNLRVTDVTGLTRYLSGIFYYGALVYPGSVAKTVTLNADDPGISVGTGNTPATEDDIQLEATITSGVNLTMTEIVYGADSPCIPYVQYKVTVTNTGSEPLTVKEIGYKQLCYVAKYPGYTSDKANKVLLIDRTVLDTPVTIAAGDAGIITYKLRTIPQAYGTAAGVQMASFTYGTDAEICDILDAAAAGDIDLQHDAGWRVGDMRKISLAAWTGGNSVAHPAEDLYIVISQFGDYNNCGCLFQFDFVDGCAVKQRMVPTTSTAGGYSASEMYTATLPAMAAALPTWLKDRMKTFSVLTGKGGSEVETIESVENNKLALRSEVEIFGVTSLSVPGEGTQVDYYKIAGRRVKFAGTGGSSTVWYERSPFSSSRYCFVGTGGDASGQNGATQPQGVSPFGCLGGLTT